MSELVFRPAEPADFGRTVELMALGFPGVDKFSPAFLDRPSDDDIKIPKELRSHRLNNGLFPDDQCNKPTD